MNLVAILIVPFTLHPLAWTTRAIVVTISFLMLVAAVMVSHRGALVLPAPAEREHDATK